MLASSLVERVRNSISLFYSSSTFPLGSTPTLASTIHLVAFGATVATIQTIRASVIRFVMTNAFDRPPSRALPAAVEFPVTILLLTPLRSLVVPRLLPSEELRASVLDRRTA